MADLKDVRDKFDRGLKNRVAHYKSTTGGFEIHYSQDAKDGSLTYFYVNKDDVKKITAIYPRDGVSIYPFCATEDSVFYFEIDKDNTHRLIKRCRESAKLSRRITSFRPTGPIRIDGHSMTYYDKTEIGWVCHKYIIDTKTDHIGVDISNFNSAIEQFVKTSDSKPLLGLLV